MANAPPARDARHDPEYARPEDQRYAFERDRDRLIYSDALRRLAGVTQVVNPTLGHTVHNRLTHTLRVAQLGRRIAEKIPRDNEALAGKLNVSPDVVEAACLAHDLGHPPFGHIAEEELNALVSSTRGTDGYEGNAQSFRIVTTLEVRDNRGETARLNLTRATLNAILKYPWFRKTWDWKWLWKEPELKSKKWGAYWSEESYFDYARDGCQPDIVSQEAQIMTWADDIAYAVHDTEDFFRAGLIPLDRLAKKSTEALPEEAIRFLEWAYPEPADRSLYEPQFIELQEWFPFKPFEGERVDCWAARRLTSDLTRRFVVGTTFHEADDDGEILDRRPEDQRMVDILKKLTRKYVIDAPSLALQQSGQRKIIRELYSFFDECIQDKPPRSFALPPFFQSQYSELLNQFGSAKAIPAPRKTRLVSDTVSSYSDVDAVRIYQHITGTSQGFFADMSIG